jgi:hypothetical protein
LLLHLFAGLLLLQAAQWRQDHRSDADKARPLIVWEVDDAERWEGESVAGPLFRLLLFLV